MGEKEKKKKPHPPSTTMFTGKEAVFQREKNASFLLA